MQQAVLGSSTSQEISCIHYSVHIAFILTTVMSRMNPIQHTFQPCFLKIHFNIILLAMSVLPSSPCSFRYSEQNFAQFYTKGKKEKKNANHHDT